MVRFLLAVAVLAVCTVLVADAQEEGKKKRKGKHGVTAQVVSIDLAKDSKDEGTLTVRVLPRKRKKDASTQAAKEMKIEIKKDTKIERAGNKKKKEPPTTAALADLQTDQVITVRLRRGTDNVADQVVIRRAKKKKNVQ